MYYICDMFISIVHFAILKNNAPRFSNNALSMITAMGDWYTLEHFIYIIILGSKMVHLLPRVVPKSMALVEVSFQRVIDGVHSQIHSKKRESWPKFPFYIIHLMIKNASRGILIRNNIVHLKLGLAKKRMHDHKVFAPRLFA